MPSRFLAHGEQVSGWVSLSRIHPFALICTHGAHRINSSILRNEKYKGDALLQKTFRTDFLTKKSKINEGEVPQYYVDAFGCMYH